jgi:heme a synthase
MRRIAFAAVVFYALLVLTGGAVRLTGSGLGCPDWPTCYAHHLTAESSIHGQIEFANRVVSVVATVLSALVFLAAIFRNPRRRDLVWLASGLVAGLVAQIVLGGLVVLFKLNPYLVSLHFLLTLAILAVALALWHRASNPQTPPETLVGPDITWLSRILVVVLSCLLALGTVVTGAGPHAGGPGAKRYPVAFRDITEAHSTLALFLIGVTLATLFALHAARAPAVAQRRARVLLEVLFIQGVLGYTQYVLHDAAVVIEFHLAGATLAWCFALHYYMALHTHGPDAAPLEQRTATLDTAIADEVTGARR